ncbi:MAG: hypothetical protein ACK5KR_04750 [Breznakia sp.]
MQKDYYIYVDKIKTIFEIIVNIFFVIALGAVLIVENLNIIVFIFILVIMAFLLAYLYTKLKKITHRFPLYCIQDDGIIDYTKCKEGRKVDWLDVGRIEIAVNNTSLQIGVLSHVNVDDKNAMSESIKGNLQNNGNVAVYTVLIDGFEFRKQTFKNIFKEIKQRALLKNPHIYVEEYQSPLQRKNKNYSTNSSKENCAD